MAYCYGWLLCHVGSTVSLRLFVADGETPSWRCLAWRDSSVLSHVNNILNPSRLSMTFFATAKQCDVLSAELIGMNKYKGNSAELQLIK